MYISSRVTESTRCVFISFVHLCFFLLKPFGQHPFTTSAQKSPGAYQGIAISLHRFNQGERTVTIKQSTNGNLRFESAIRNL